METLKKITQEPLVHFIFLGFLIFVVNGFFNSGQYINEDAKIVIDDNDINRLITQYKQVWNETPDQSTIQKLIEQYIESEIIYREALAMNLDHNDEIIKRRLKQKYEFLVKDLISSSEPSEEDLKAYYEDHINDFLTDKLYTFSQYYFSPDKRQTPLEDAKTFISKQIKTNPNHSVIPPKIDQIHLKQTFAAVTEHLIRQEFGIDFLSQLETQSSHSWIGPISSGFGIHILYFDSINESQKIEFEQVREKVKLAYEDDLTSSYNSNVLNKVKDSYEIKYDLNKWEKLID